MADSYRLNHILEWMNILWIIFSLKMGNQQSQQPEDKKEKPEKQKWEPPLPTRVGKKKRKGPDSITKLPPGIHLITSFPNFSLQTKAVKE